MNYQLAADEYSLLSIERPSTDTDSSHIITPLPIRPSECPFAIAVVVETPSDSQVDYLNLKCVFPGIFSCHTPGAYPKMPDLPMHSGYEVSHVIGSAPCGTPG